MKWKFYAAGFALLTACAPQYTPVSFVSQGDRIIATGAIDHTTLDAFLQASAQNPDAKTLVLQHIEGSVDDEANVIFSRVVRERGFNTLVPSDGLVASGGTDLFLAGRQRTLEPGACVGVHSWGGFNIEGSELPKDDPEHKRYLDYYTDIGVDEDFYWFTLEAAPADGMHWMNTTEAVLYGTATGQTPQLGSAETCDAR